MPSRYGRSPSALIAYHTAQASSPDSDASPPFATARPSASTNSAAHAAVERRATQPLQHARRVRTDRAARTAARATAASRRSPSPSADTSSPGAGPPRRAAARTPTPRDRRTPTSSRRDRSPTQTSTSRSPRRRSAAGSPRARRRDPAARATSLRPACAATRRAPARPTAFACSVNGYAAGTPDGLTSVEYSGTRLSLRASRSSLARYSVSASAGSSTMRSSPVSRM